MEKDDKIEIEIRNKGNNITIKYYGVKSDIPTALIKTSWEKGIEMLRTIKKLKEDYLLANPIKLINDITFNTKIP